MSRLFRTLRRVLAVGGVAVLLAACHSVGSVDQATGPFKPGTYQATASGHSGDVTVQVTLSANQITDVTIVKQTETSGVSDDVLKAFTRKIVEAQSLDLDTVSGATATSEAILQAVEGSLGQAGGKKADLVPAKTTAVAAKTQELQADVAVIGAGASGITAAVAASDKGAKVVLLEKTAILGGASNYSWAARFFNSSAAAAAGNAVDLNGVISHWIESNHWRVNAADVREYVTKSGASYDWLNQHGYQTAYFNFGGAPLHILPAYETRQDLFKAMVQKSVIAKGGQVLTQVTAQKLLTSSSGSVVGVEAVASDGTKVVVHAKAVIIATGGYAGNAKMVKEASGYEGPLGGLSQNVGEGLEMGWAVGAAKSPNFGVQMIHQTQTEATPFLKKTFDPFRASFPLMLSYLPTVMNVGPNGLRFRDEAALLGADSAAITSVFNGPYHLVIVTQSQLDRLTKTGMKGLGVPSLPAMPPEFYLPFKDQFTLDTPWTNATEVLDAMVAGGFGFKGATPEDLAKKAGLNAQAFAAQVHSYDEATKTGVDDEFGKSASLLAPLGQGPYYAIVAQVNNLGSVGGLSVNKQFQVLDQNKLPIAGLYSVGLDSEGGLFGDAYIGFGDGVGYAFTSGRLGGESAALYSSKL